ncbi:hypothetical protein AGMMS50255_0580 [Spirochaetia bacterium]|nr:hypothetical protein AGMMS50255_0580 [Spirochaetia bacterium]
MAKKEKAIYAPGELDRIRGKLGVTDANEAKRLAEMLGGEVGVERRTEPSRAPSRRRSGSTALPGEAGQGSDRGGGSVRRQPMRRVEPAGDENEEPDKSADDPLIPVKTSYFERIKMDRLCAQPEFDIKSPVQAMVSIISFFGKAPDLVNPHFITHLLNDYYKQIERLVTSTRTLLPRNNLKRNEKLKRVSPFMYSILDTIRRWDLEKIAAEIAKLQAHPRNVKVTECSELLKQIYRPLFILEQMDMEIHIKGAFKLLYKLLYIESPIEAKAKYQELIRIAISGFGDIRRDIYYRLYPLLMKILSDCMLPYELFFLQQHNRFMSFIAAAEADQINPANINARFEGQKDDGDTEEEDTDDPEAAARTAKQTAQAAEQKALDRGLATLETLFPGAGWDKLSEYPDMYPYFREVLDFKRGYELISPRDPLLQIVILMRILEELFFALRYVIFSRVTEQDDTSAGIDEFLRNIANDWHHYIDTSFEKEYLPRLTEYCRILENSSESRTSSYAKRTLDELHWVKRLYFLPYYKFESAFPPPFQKKDVIALYSEIRQLRRSLTMVAAGIEQGYKRGGAEKMAPCEGIDNPWAPYNFEVPNPVSRRLNALLSPGKRNNASLVFFSLAVTAVLDHIVNDESGWVYNDRPGPLFRSVNGAGIIPQFGVDDKIDADQIFKDAMKEKNNGL